MFQLKSNTMSYKNIVCSIAGVLCEILGHLDVYLPVLHFSRIGSSSSHGFDKEKIWREGERERQF